MAKITRTFRLDQELVKRFDEATEVTGTEKTKVVEEAIKKFVEGYEMKKFWNTEKLVVVEEVFVPILGKCQAKQGEVNLNEDLKVLQTSLKALNNERKTDEGTYTIDNVFATLDFENKVAKVEYKKFWKGGIVESEETNFEIDWTEKVGPI